MARSNPGSPLLHILIAALMCAACTPRAHDRHTPAHPAAASPGDGPALALPLTLDAQAIAQAPPRDSVPEQERRTRMPALAGPLLRIGHVAHQGSILPIVCTATPDGRQAAIHALMPLGSNTPKPVTLGEYRVMGACTLRSHTRIDSSGAIRRMDQWLSGPAQRLNAESLRLWSFAEGAWHPEAPPPGTLHLGVFRDTAAPGPDGETTLLRLELWEQSPGKWRVAAEYCREEEDGSISQCSGIGDLSHSPSARHTAYLAHDIQGRIVCELIYSQLHEGGQQIILEDWLEGRPSGLRRTFQRHSVCE